GRSRPARSRSRRRPPKPRHPGGATLARAPPTIATVRSGPARRSGTLPGMRAYLLSRLGQTLLVVFLSLTAVFFLVRLGGDPVLLFLPMHIQAKDLNEFRERLGFTDPVAVPYS